MRKSAQAAEQRTACKEEKLDAEMKSLTAKPQEWKAAAQAYLTQQALDAFHAQERSSASLPAAGQGKSIWERAEEKLTNGLITLGQKSPIARQALLNLSNAWFHYVQPTVNAAADFIGGFTVQTIQNNLDALAMIAPMPPQMRENYHNGWESLHSGRSVWYQAGRFVGSMAGIAQGFWEMGSGIATATGGTVVSCGTVVLCFAGGGAAVVTGSAVAAHGAFVTTAGIVNTIESARALFSAAQGGSGLLGQSVPGHPEAKYVKTRTPAGPARDYEARVLNKPDPNVEIEVNGVKFDWYEGDTLLDAKHAGETRSWYDISKPDGFTQKVKVEDVLDQARRQANALDGSSFTRIEWRVADPEVARILRKFFTQRPELENISVVYAP